MRAPSSFKGEIAAFRQRLIDNPAPVHVGNRWRYELTMKVLARLERHVTEKTWNQIDPHLPVGCSCSLVILAIIRNAILAEGLKGVREQAPSTEEKVRTLGKRFVNAKSAEVDLQQLSDAIGALREFQVMRKILPLREKTAPRNHFMTNLRTWFQEVCKKPLDDIVAELTNIVFDLQPRPEKGEPSVSPEKIQVSGEAVRSAARTARTRARQTK